MKIFVIVLINGYDSNKVSQDEIRLHNAGYKGCKILIPNVRVLKRIVYRKETFEYKPLLFRYGFMELPIYYAVSFEHLEKIKGYTSSILGFMMRRKNDLLQERLRVQSMEETRGKSLPQILPEHVNPEEVDKLFEAARLLSVYDKNTELAIGSYVILRGYPFDNMAAEILSKQANYVKVRLLGTGYEANVQVDNIYYSPYFDELPKYKEVCFTDLGYIPDI